ncbi:hypothetical protein YC2023_009852 [Brassica napus]
MAHHPYVLCTSVSSKQLIKTKTGICVKSIYLTYVGRRSRNQIKRGLLTISKHDLITFFLGQRFDYLRTRSRDITKINVKNSVHVKSKCVEETVTHNGKFFYYPILGASTCRRAVDKNDQNISIILFENSVSYISRSRQKLIIEIRIRSEIRSGSVIKIGYLRCLDLYSKILNPSKSNPDPDILIFRSGYPDPDPFTIRIRVPESSIIYSWISKIRIFGSHTSGSGD